MYFERFSPGEKFYKSRVPIDASLDAFLVLYRFRFFVLAKLKPNDKKWRVASFFRAFKLCVVKIMVARHHRSKFFNSDD